ncbi:MAG: YfhO family protein [Bacteroidetes bacterium]|nr:YfhO family protein [Bacteroidota bacterium]
MPRELFKKILPHVGVLAVFLLTVAIFCRPALEGEQLNQHDNVSWKGMAQNAFEYKAAKGHFPLWNPNLFGGMPNYQIAMEGKSILPDLIQLFSLGLPKPMNFFFLACLFFYFLSLSLGASPLIGATLSLAYAFSTYNPVIIAAGHDTQMIATACMPLLLAGLILLYNKSYWIGLSVTTLGAYLLIAANHLQITYYFLLIAIILTLSFAFSWINNKEWRHLGLAAFFTLVSAFLAIGGNALILWTSAEYSKYTMRGGKEVSITADAVKSTQTAGLDTSYAFEYSLGNRESLTLLLPNAFGGGHSRNLEEGSPVAHKLIAAGIDEGSAEQLSQSLPQYWGKLPYTAGPAYVGVLLFVLGTLGFFINRGAISTSMLAITLMGVFISWGKNFPVFNLFLFEYLPLFNKFRAPSMAQVIPQLGLAVSSLLLLNNIIQEKISLFTKKTMTIVGSLFGCLFLLWLLQDYSAPIDEQLLNAYTDKNGSDQLARSIIAGLQETRSNLFGEALLRAILLTGLLGGLLWAFTKKWLSTTGAMGLILLISTAEILAVSHDYLDQSLYLSAEEYGASNFTPSQIDQEILKDKDPNYRVLNLATSTFNDAKTSFFHKSVGGYHAAKLRIYQDVIEKYFNAGLNQGILNMLNTRYIIVSDPNSGQQSLLNNDQAYGNCWLVSQLVTAPNKAEVLKKIGTITLSDTAVIEQAHYKGPLNYQRDSSATIALTKFDNDTLTYAIKCNSPQFAVFSEIYYPKGWNAYLDQKLISHHAVNHILRGVELPAGEHAVQFIFEPESYKKGTAIMNASSYLILLVVIGGLAMGWRAKLKRHTK